MTITLYRKMSIEEAEKTLKNGHILLSDNVLADKRKWFTTTPFVTSLSHNPYFGSSPIILAIEVNRKYFEKVLSCGVEVRSGFSERPEAYVFMKVYKNIDDIYNIGVTDLDELNANITSIKPLDAIYEEVLEERVLGEKLSNLKHDMCPLQDNEFYLQTPYDVAIMMLHYQTLFREIIMLKKAHFSTEIKYLERVNFGRGQVTLKVRFKNNFKNTSLYSITGFSASKAEIDRIGRYVAEISLHDFKPSIFIHPEKRFLSSRENPIGFEGDNKYTYHNTRVYPTDLNIGYDDFEEITERLLRENFKLEMIEPFLYIVKDIYGIMQVDPKHIDSLKTYIEKSIVMSNLVINYLNEMGIEYTAEELIRLKWTLLLNNFGKPYTKYSSSSKYSQFLGHQNYLEKLLACLFIDDFGFDITIINRLLEFNNDISDRKINTNRKRILEEINKRYSIDNTESLKKLLSYIKIAFACKVSQIASLKPNRFYSNYMDCLAFIKSWDDILWFFHKIPCGINYEDLYFDYSEAYRRIVETYYSQNTPTTSAMVWNLLKSDYNDLSLVYNYKNRSIHHLNDDEQLDYDSLVSIYFREEDELAKKYFNEPCENLDAHGDAHSARVAVYCYLLGKMNSLKDADIEVLLIASKYHDIGRIHDMDDTIHGRDSVNIAKSRGLTASCPNVEYIHFLMESHSLPDEKRDFCIEKYNLESSRAITLYNIFKDADALDRVRFDNLKNHTSALNIRYFRTELARRLVKFAYLLNTIYNMKKRSLNPSISNYILLSQNRH